MELGPKLTNLESVAEMDSGKNGSSVSEFNQSGQLLVPVEDGKIAYDCKLTGYDTYNKTQATCTGWLVGYITDGDV